MGRYPDQISHNPVPTLALRQQGNVTRAQLQALGVTPSAIKRRVRSGVLFPSFSGVYAVGRPARTPIERAAAAVLACGSGAALSHTSALALWELAAWPATPHVTVERDRRPKGIVTHRCSKLLPGDIRRHHGVAVTSLARALLDCAPRLTSKALTRTVNAALRTPYLSRPSLADMVERNPLHPGAKLLRPHLEHQNQPTRSQLEDDFLAFCRRHGLPTPQINTHVCGREVDAYFPDQRLIVELDGWVYHSDRHAFERDRLNDTEALAQGITTARLTWERIHRQPHQEARRLDKILRARAA